MFKLIAAVVLVLLCFAVACGLFVADAQAKSYGRSDFHRIAKQVYDGKAKATRHERRTLYRVIANQVAPRKSRPIIALHQRRYRNLHLYRLAVAAVTPYRGPQGQRVAIPWYIVYCESRGLWSAANPSGAIGIYQLLGKGAPWPANTRAARLEHHRIAYNLYAGGAGASHWVCA